MGTMGARRTVRGVALAGAALSMALSVALTLGAGTAGAKGSSASLTQAKTKLLKLTDMPKGWTSSANPNSNGGGFPGQAQLAACIGVPTSTITLNPPNVNSPSFGDKAQSQMVSENISVFSSNAVARKELAAVTNAKTPACYARILNGTLKTQLEIGFGAGSTIGKITVKKASSASAAGFGASFTVVYQGVSVPLTLTTLFAIKGTEGMQLQFTGIGKQFPSSLEKHLTTLSVGRL
jgi:hypothetical protein